MGTYRVRPAVAGDLEAILRLQDARAEEAGATVPPPTAGAPEAATWTEMMATPNLRVYVAEQGGEIVGNTCVTLVPNLINGCRPTAFVEPMLVAADHRRRGVGRLLVDRMLDDLRATGCYKVQLLSHKRHAEDGAHAFYESFGFATEAEGFRLYMT